MEIAGSVMVTVRIVNQSQVGQVQVYFAVRMLHHSLGALLGGHKVHCQEVAVYKSKRRIYTRGHAQNAVLFEATCTARSLSTQRSLRTF
jgi:hypothetical protein